MNYTIFFSGGDSRFGAFVGLCGLSMPASRAGLFTAGLDDAAAVPGGVPIAWEDLSTDERRRRAEKLIDFVVENVAGFGLRLEVGVGESRKARETESAGHEERYLAAMAVRLLQDASMRREDGAGWSLFCRNPRLLEAFRREGPSIAAGGLDCRRPSASTGRGCAVADLFAAAGAFSRDRANQYLTWALATGETDISLGTGPGEPISGEDHQKFLLVRHLNRKCRSRNLGVSLISCGFLWTPNPEDPLNFRHFPPRSVL